ncbi:SWI/SNF-related matrix-associated actin-dependent regulator of chromatin subfamily A-like protein 1, partial [Halocaridina rubra]
MNNLTAEQRQRMEENRKKALQKLNRLKSSSTGASSNSNGSKLTGTSLSRNTLNSSVKSLPHASSSFPSNIKSSFSEVKATEPVSNTSLSLATSPNNKSSSKPVINSYEMRRIEENRQRALEKRAALHLSTSGNVENEYLSINPNQVTSKGISNFYKSSPSATSDINANKSASGRNFVAGISTNSSGNPCSSGFTGYNGGLNTPKSGYQPKAMGMNSKNEDKIASLLKEADEGPKPVLGKAITGTFRLMSRERFVADVGYYAPMIEIFKTMQSRKYDPESRKWNFSLSEHDNLAEALRPLRPSACISPLPHFVRKTLQAADKQMPSSCVDLFGLDPKLLDALMPFQHEGV